VKRLEAPSGRATRFAAGVTLLVGAALVATAAAVGAQDDSNAARVAHASAAALAGAGADAASAAYMPAGDSVESPSSAHGAASLDPDSFSLPTPAFNDVAPSPAPTQNPGNLDPMSSPVGPTHHSPHHPTPPPTPTPTPTSAPIPAPPPPDGIIHTDGSGHLTLNGARYQFTGVDAFELATLWGTNSGCGAEIDNLDGFFKSLAPNNVVRFWAFQDFTRNLSTGKRDWGPIDRVVQSAERTHQRLLFVLADQWANCPGEQYKDAAFYRGGYQTSVPPGEVETYWAWVRDVVTRYRSSPAVGMWEPLSEAQGDCSTIGSDGLRRFFDSVGGLIKSIDSKHLVESGVLGTGQCGITGTDFFAAQNTPNVDVVSYHDYGDSTPVPGLLALRLQQAQQLNKPLIVGEVGFLSDCATMQAKRPAQFAAGVAGFMPWNWDGPWMGVCGL
jgi:mannan endo-1,4-beta-mannosidase